MQNSLSWNSTVQMMREDFARYTGIENRSPFIFFMKLFHNPGMSFSIWYRCIRFLLHHENFLIRMIGIIVYPLYFFITYYIFDYHIEPEVNIAGGLFLHNRSVVITNNTIIGKNASIMGQVTIGTGFETNDFDIRIGHNVQIGAGAKIIAKGTLRIADNVTIGANAVVVKDILKSGIYAGVPVRRISK